MARRVAGLSALGVGSVFALVLLVATGLGTVNTWAQRISFAIATGPSGGTYFPMGQALAGVISHPPGVDRCSNANVCGPEGLIATAQTSPGSYANVLAVNSGRVDSALAQSDVVAQAVAGKGAFKTAQIHLRTIAVLFPEDVHVVVANRIKIASISDLRGKRVSLGALNSGTAITARAVLAAYRLSPKRLRLSNDSADSAAQKLAAGQLDAFFFVGGAPVPLVQRLLAAGRAHLIAIDGDGRKRLIAALPGVAPDTITAGTYGSMNATQTVSVQAVWIVNDSEPADIVYGLAKALFNSANRNLLDNGPPSAHQISLNRATLNISARLHPGAERFYKEVRKLQKSYTIAPR
jgi:TRAP transporter TAXI family solute receptor